MKGAGPFKTVVFWEPSRSCFPSWPAARPCPGPHGKDRDRVLPVASRRPAPSPCLAIDRRGRPSRSTPARTGPGRSAHRTPGRLVHARVARTRCGSRTPDALKRFRYRKPALCESATNVLPCHLIASPVSARSGWAAAVPGLRGGEPRCPPATPAAGGQPGARHWRDPSGNTHTPHRRTGAALHRHIRRARSHSPLVWVFHAARDVHWLSFGARAGFLRTSVDVSLERTGCAKPTAGQKQTRVSCLSGGRQGFRRPSLPVCQAQPG